MTVNRRNIAKIIIFLACLFLLSGCRQADIARHNARKEADDFNTRRRLTVFNTRTDRVLLQMEGLMSISTDEDGDLNIMTETEEGKYELNYVHLSNDVTYLIEDISGGQSVSKYSYEISFYPEKVKYGIFDLTTDNGPQE